MLLNLTVGGIFDCPNIYTKTQSDALLNFKISKVEVENMIVKRYTLSNINGWLHLGTLNSGYNGRCTKLNIICTDGYNPSGRVYKNRYANIFFLNYI